MIERVRNFADRYKSLILLAVVMILSGWRVAGDLLIDGDLCFEGATADAFETCIVPTDATADRAITLPDDDLTVGAGGGANVYLFNLTMGHGTSAGNWNTSSLPPGCFTSTVPVGTGGTNVSAGTGIWTDADTEIMECRIGRIPADVTLTNVTIEYDAQQVVNGVADYSLDFDWYCVAAGDTFFASYVDPPTPVLITGTGVGTIASADFMPGSATGVDLTQDSSGCVAGQLLVVKFTRSSADSSTNDLRVMNLRAYTPVS